LVEQCRCALSEKMDEDDGEWRRVTGAVFFFSGEIVGDNGDAVAAVGAGRRRLNYDGQT